MLLTKNIILIKKKYDTRYRRCFFFIDECLPRGCFSDLVELLEYIGVAYEIDDRRMLLKEINVEYNAILRVNQKNAVDTLLKYDNGLLIAPTGSGKTIMGMEVISRIKKPTLILVEKVKLLEQ